MGEYYVEKENARMASNGIEFFPQYFGAEDRLVHPHIHSAVEILYCTDGEFQVCCNETEHRVRPGDAILCRSNAIHTIFALKRPGTYWVIKLSSAFILELSSPQHGPTYLLSLTLQGENAKIHWTAEECEHSGIGPAVQRMIAEQEQERYGTDMALKLGAAQVLLAMLRDLETGSRTLPDANENLARRIYESIMFINRHYAEEITVLDCSRHVFMSYSYFSRSFKQITGKTFKDYLTATRIDRAEKELVATERSITQIAADCGFNNISYFISTYKKIKGITPAAFRSGAKK